MAVMGSPHGFLFAQKNKLTMFGAHCPFNPLVQLAESKAQGKAITCQTLRTLNAKLE
jgi:hypothetical protein